MMMTIQKIFNEQWKKDESHTKNQNSFYVSNEDIFDMSYKVK